MADIVMQLLRSAGIAITPAIIGAIVACAALKCMFNDDDCIDAIKGCIRDILGIKL